MSILIGVLTFLLVLVSAFLILVVLAQKAKSDGGVGAAMGGSMVESAFGAEGGNVLSKSTINAAIAFFILSRSPFISSTFAVESFRPVGNCRILPCQRRRLRPLRSPCRPQARHRRLRPRRLQLQPRRQLRPWEKLRSSRHPDVRSRWAVGGRQYLLSLFCLCAPQAHAQRFRPPEQYVQIGKPDQAEGKKLLEEFRGLGIAASYYFDFELHILPRRGDERIVAGRLWGSRAPAEARTRIEFSAEAGGERLIVVNGADPMVFRFDPKAGGPAQNVQSAILPLAGTDLTAFDLQMPFLYWTDYVYEGTARLRSRPAAQFILYPPAGYAARYPGLTGVRIYIDSQYKALVQSEQIGTHGEVLKTWTIVGLKQMGETYIPKEIEVRDEATRNKTRFTVTGAAIDPILTQGLFTPDSLSSAAGVPASGVTRVDP